MQAKGSTKRNWSAIGLAVVALAIGAVLCFAGAPEEAYASTATSASDVLTVMSHKATVKKASAAKPAAKKATSKPADSKKASGKMPAAELVSGEVAFSDAASKGASAAKVTASGSKGSEQAFATSALGRSSSGFKLISEYEKSCVKHASKGKSQRFTIVHRMPQITGYKSKAQAIPVTISTMPFENGKTYMLKSTVGSNRYLNVANGSQKDGANVQTWGKMKSAASETWQVKVKGNYIMLINCWTCKALDVKNNGTKNKTNV